MFVAKRILIITPDLKFARNAKKALERNGRYTVTTFTSGKAGVDFLRQNEQDVAFLDFRMKDMPGTDMIDHLRAMQPNIGVIVSPDHPSIRELQDRYNIQGIISIPISTRNLVKMLEGAANAMQTPQPDEDSERLPFVEGVSVSRSPEMLEFWLADNSEGETVVDFSPVQESEISPESSMTFERLKAEEPPMPEFADGSTLRDLRERLTNIEVLQRVLSDTAQQTTDSDQATGEEEHSDTSSIPAVQILMEAEDGSTPIQTYKLNEFMQRIKERGLDGVNPLPIWKERNERYITEPDFLPSDLPFPELGEAIEYTGTVTISNSVVTREDVGDMTTETIDPVVRTRPAEEKLDSPEPVEPQTDVSIPSPIVDTPQPATDVSDLSVVADGEMEEVPFTKVHLDDPELAQLATTLTQVALELTADATVLARDGEVIAFAGKLPLEYLDGLKAQLTTEWDKAASSNRTRILFAKLPETAEEFMVSTRQTEFGYALSLIFAGTRPLQDIRRQSERLLEALSALPEPDVDIPAIDDTVSRTSVTYLWALRDENLELGQSTEAAVRQKLANTLRHDGWIINDVQVADYVYVTGEMPEILKPNRVLDNLREQSAKFLDKDPSLLWDDSYLMLQPGREMSVEEIQRFINFVRR